MKILIASHRGYPVLGGLERHIYKYAKYITDNNPIQILNLVFGKNIQLLEINDNFTIKAIKSYFIFSGAFPVPSLFSIIKYYKEIKEYKPDIVHTHGRYFISTIIAKYYSNRFNIKHVHTEHIEGEIYFKNKFIKGIVNKVVEIITRWLFRNTILVTGVSKTTSDFLIENYGVDTTIVPNFIDPTEIDSEIASKNLPQEVDSILNSKNFKVVFPYRLVESKGYKKIEEFSKLNPEIELLIVGGGEGVNYIKELSSRNSKISYLGELNHNQTMQVLNRCDGLLNLSDQEGLSTTILEAMYLNKDIIATNIPSNKELLHSYNNKILLNKPETINVDSIVIKEKSDVTFTSENSAKMYLDIYKKLLK